MDRIILNEQQKPLNREDGTIVIRENGAISAIAIDWYNKSHYAVIDQEEEYVAFRDLNEIKSSYKGCEFEVRRNGLTIQVPTEEEENTVYLKDLNPTDIILACKNSERVSIVLNLPGVGWKCIFPDDSIRTFVTIHGVVTALPDCEFYRVPGTIK